MFIYNLLSFPFLTVSLQESKILIGPIHMVCGKDVTPSSNFKVANVVVDEAHLVIIYL